MSQPPAVTAPDGGVASVSGVLIVCWVDWCYDVDGVCWLCAAVVRCEVCRALCQPCIVNSAVAM